ncbi:hypothetical protein LIER_13988 [Lithospermum erythrorhizon]|uniref:Uncharacterized protein n=1 Tax=Lithospermum erythrorhizon TaxID=34254 RepID=A0AAV3Q0L9_LITER
MVELTNAKKHKKEPVTDFINIWTSLSIKCKYRQSVTSTIIMCIQGIYWNFKYILQANQVSIKPKKTIGGFNLGDKRRLTLKEIQTKEYPFLDSEVPIIFDGLLKEKQIELPEYKRPEEAKRSTKPNYYKYHCLLGHPTENCFTFTEKLLR